VIEMAATVDASKNKNLLPTSTSRAEVSEGFSLGKGQSSAIPLDTTRAESLDAVAHDFEMPSPEHIKRAIAMADDISRHRKFPISHQGVQRLLEHFWRRHRDDPCPWHLAFRDVLINEANAMDRYRERRHKWDRQQRQRKADQDARDWMNKLRSGRGQSGS
jgi:hypothetical protein